MPAYVIARLTVSDPESYQRYARRFREVVAPFEGRVLALSDAPEVLEGDEPHSRVVLLTFPSAPAARGWYHSPAYQEISADRKAASDGVVLVLDGPPPGWE